MMTSRRIVFALCLVLISIPMLGADPAPQAVVTHASGHPEGTAAFSFDKSAFEEDLKHLPIGVFDSGIGGLTVLEAILALDAFNNETMQPGADGRRDFENERFIYLGDQANMPYGNYPSLGREPFLHELIMKDALFLLGKRYWKDGADEPSFDKPPVKAIVIACNTATAYGLEEIREAIEGWGIPVFVVGVVEAGARGVKELESTGTVAVMATVGTCRSEAYPRAIGKALGKAGKSVPDIVQQGSVGLAGAIEGNSLFIGSPDSPDYQGPSTSSESAPLPVERLHQFGFDPDGLSGDPETPETLRLNSVANYVRYDVGMLVEQYREAGGGEPIGTVVLGCTHFPLVTDEILDAFKRLRGMDVDGATPYGELIAESISVVDPAELTAKELFRGLALAKTRLTGDERSVMDHDAFFISVPNDRSPGIELDPSGGLTKDYKYGRDPGKMEREDTINVPLTVEMLPPASHNLIKENLPEVWSRLKKQ